MSRALHLVCEGLDTIASVTVNGINVGQSSNQFLRYIFDITPHVKVKKIAKLGGGGSHYLLSLIMVFQYIISGLQLSDVFENLSRFSIVGYGSLRSYVVIKK